MSPRSAEFMAAAREGLRAARAAVAGGFYPSAASTAYYAMLYAARAALSEEELNAKTHAGAWNLFHETFVASGAFDSELAANARDTQKVREGVDYDALMVPREQAEEIVALADRFVSAITLMLS